MFYFAYGSNMSLERMKKRGIKIKSDSAGVLFNYKLAFNKMSSKVFGAGFANVMPKYGYKTEGVLYHIEDESILALDKYEGFPNHYNREWVYIYNIQLKTMCLAVMYFAQAAHVNENLKPTKEYLDFLLERPGFVSKEYYTELQSITTLAIQVKVNKG